MPTPLLTIASAGINLGDRWLLRNADLTLHAGDRLALVGRNGAGKSSLMKLMDIVDTKRPCGSHSKGLVFQNSNAIQKTINLWWLLGPNHPYKKLRVLIL